MIETYTEVELPPEREQARQMYRERIMAYISRQLVITAVEQPITIPHQVRHEN